MKKINHSQPHIDLQDLKAVSKSIKTGWLAHGENNKIFENDFRKIIGSKYAISCNSWTSGAYALLEALGKKGEIILPSYTFVASANVIVNTGNTPIFCDINPLNGNTTAEFIEKCISKKTIAIMIVHFAGQTCEMTPIMKLCKKNKIMLIEDAAENLGGKYKNRIAGSFGNSIYSFFPSKNITTGEGGMITTNNAKLANKIRTIIAHGIFKDPKKEKWYRNAILAGHNFRLTNFQSALGISQLNKLNYLNKKRINLANIYDKAFLNIKEIKILHKNKNIRNVYQMYFIRVNKKIRNKLVNYLNLKNIEASVHFDPPVHRQKFYKKYFKKQNNKLLNTDILSSEIITLPIYPDMKKIDQKIVIKEIKSFFIKYK